MQDSSAPFHQNGLLPVEVKCYMAPSVHQPLVPGTITRRAAAPNDVVIAIDYAGICHSDIHCVHDDWEQTWGKGIFPMVPGHEIAGRVVALGSKASKFKIGQKVGVGCMVDSCRNCVNCRLGEEQFCSSGMILTYGSRYRFPHCAEYSAEGGNVTYGGYSQSIVVDEAYVVSIPDNLDFSKTAPLLCAGVTTYSPLIHFGLRPHHRYAVAGLGGLGHMAVKFGVAFGAHVTVLSRGQAKKEGALKDLGAHGYVDMTNPEEVKAAMGSFDFILNTIAVDFDVNLYVRLLKLDGRMVMVGAPGNAQKFYAHPFIEGRRSLSGSAIGGIRETQEMLDFCGRHNITCDVEVISADKINEAYERTVKGDVKYRFVIDTSTMK